jgi:arginyl-tRNA synthetase
MIRQHLLNTLKAVLHEQGAKLNLPADNGVMDMLNVERPRQTDHGDYAVNVSPLAKFARMAPPQIASIVAEGFAPGTAHATDWTLSVIGGYVNFSITEQQLTQSLVRLALQEHPGQNKTFADTRLLMEFVSANPTGPLHIGHGRWVALGDSLSRLFTHCGAHVHKEFYVNDAGKQMRNLGLSLWYRSLEILGKGKMPDPPEGEKDPFYRGEFVTELAERYLQLPEFKQQIDTWTSADAEPSDEVIERITELAATDIRKDQDELMAKCRLTFDHYFSEKQDLYAKKEMDTSVEKLKAQGVTYEKDGALWFASTRFGDDQDRVLIKSDGSYTYLTPDIAYHENKYTRDNASYNLIMNIWGADHHGYIPRMKAAIQALGHDPAHFEVILGQLVNLIVDGERTRMGKRKKMLTLADLVEEVGVDATRFWMVSKSQDTALDFNVELAKSSSDENPVFYVQYAHARCASILRNAFSPRLDTLSKEELPPILQEAEWDAFLAALTPASLATLFTDLENEAAQAPLKELILKLDSFEDRVVDAVRQRSPHIIARYTQELAADFHHFYNVCRILSPDPERTKVRLVIIHTLKRVLAQALDLLGVSAPEKM